MQKERFSLHKGLLYIHESCPGNVPSNPSLQNPTKPIAPPLPFPIPAKYPSFAEQILETPKFTLVCNLPAVEPLEVPPLAAGSYHTKRDGAEEPVQANHQHVQRREDAPLHLLGQLPRAKVEAEAHN